MATTTTETPMMKQYREIKATHPDRVLLFRCGDFYETYEDDAKKCADILGITLTKHKAGYQMTGFPYHALDTYLPKLMKAGCRVAICDQLEDPILNERIKRRISDTFNADIPLNDQPKATKTENKDKINSQILDSMEANNLKAADLIGKTIIVGENIATIIIKSADGDTLQTEFKKADSPTGMPLPVTMENLRQQIESGAWRIEGCDNANGKHEPETSNQPDPVLKLWSEAKGRHPEKVIMFRNGNTLVAIAEDAEKVAAAAGLKTVLSNGTAICVFPHSDMDAVFRSVLKAGHNIAIEDFEVGSNGNVNPEPESSVNHEPAEPKAQHRVKPKAAQEIDDGNENENMEPETLEPETKDAKPQPKSKPSDVTVEPEDGKPFIREVGKSIIVAGDTSKIEAVLLTMWGRKRPYTHKGKTYSGIQLSAKHKATVVEVIKLAS